MTQPLSIAAAAGLLRRGETSSVELTQHYLHVIERCEPTIGAFITICPDEALAAARAADALFRAGYDLGLLQGIPLALKDNIDTAGIRTTVGSAILRDNVPRRDAPVVQLLKAAGTVVLGKTNLHEFTLGATTENPYYGTTRNPWDPARIASGSSGGSAAAVAAGECLGSLASDTSGSVRMPAAMVGITGLRPTYGLVSTEGVFPLSRTADAVGPMARSVADVAALLDCIAPGRPRRPKVRTLRGMRIGVMRDFATGRLALGVGELFERALQDLAELGAESVDVVAPKGFDRFQSWRRMRLAETAAIHRDWLTRYPDGYSSQVRADIEAGLAVTAVQYLEAADVRAQITAGFDAIFEEVDLLATPTTPCLATPVGQDWVNLRGERQELLPTLLRYATIASCIGAPAISLPCGFAGGLPAGLQLTAPRFAESLLLDVGRAYEGVNDWQLQLPPDCGAS